MGNTRSSRLHSRLPPCNQSLFDNPSNVELGSITAPTSEINVNYYDEMILTNAEHLEDDRLITMSDFDCETSASKLSQISQTDGVSENHTTNVETSSMNLNLKKKKKKED